MTPKVIADAAGTDITPNLLAVVAGLTIRGDAAGLDAPHRFAHYLGQLLHESGSFRYDREIWGPTAQQLRYECDPRQPFNSSNSRNRLAYALGNSEPGDGRRFSGHGPLQVTGRANHRAFTRWARAHFPAAPDFEADPGAINTDPWEGLSPIWYWETRGLGALADGNHIEAITRRINGGVNGYADRRVRYARSALAILGRDPADVRGFQRDAGLRIDGISGQMTEAAMHAALGRLPASSWSPTFAPSPEDRLKALEARVAQLERRIRWRTSPTTG